MNNTQLFIPSKIRIGFNNRTDTYTGKLAYIIYYDTKGQLRKQKSWESWRNKKIDPQEFNNDPTEGFVINKNVGGARHSYGWNARNEYVRIFDPRGFEFEISTANLLFILQESNSIKGKGLEGEFVYSWDGTEIVLLPVCCQEYKACTNFTVLQSKKFSFKDLEIGCTYQNKREEKLVYLGRFKYYSAPNLDYYNRGIYSRNGKMKHVFLEQGKQVTHSGYSSPRLNVIFDPTNIAFKLEQDKINVSNYVEEMLKHNRFHDIQSINVEPGSTYLNSSNNDLFDIIKPKRYSDYGYNYYSRIKQINDREFEVLKTDNGNHSGKSCEITATLTNGSKIDIFDLLDLSH